MRKRLHFRQGIKIIGKQFRKKLRKEIRQSKKLYKEKVESQFMYGNMADAWRGLKTLTGQTKPKSVSCMITPNEQLEFSEKLNDFYCRFERDDVDDELAGTIERLRESVSKHASERNDIAGECDVDPKDVESVFLRLKTKKAVGPDNISGRLLKQCAAQLCQVFSVLFSWSLRECCVPKLWKTSVICPVPKNNNPTSLND